MDEAQKRIITIDDEENICRLIRRILEPQGYVIDESANAADGWNKIISGRYDLALLDLMMDGMTPGTLIKYLRGAGSIDPVLGRTKVLLVSAVPVPASERQRMASQYPVVGYIEKPFTKENLIEKVRSAIEGDASIPKHRGEGPSVGDKTGRIMAGSLYIIEENDTDWVIRLFLAKKNGGAPAIMITRTKPAQIREKYDVSDTSVYWLTDIGGEREIVCGLQDLSILINDFMREHNQGVVLLEGLEYLMVNHDFHLVLKFIQHLRDVMAKSGGTALVPVNPDAIDKQKLALLEIESKIR